MTLFRSSLLALLAGLLTFAVTAATGGLSPSLIEPDEGGHYVNALFLGDWLRAGLPSPMPFAREFYAHFPRLSIGHWPPGWYMLEAPAYALLRPTPFQASGASALIAGLPALAIAWAMHRIARPWLSVALVILYALLPLTLDAGRYILVDQPLTLTVAMAVFAWAAASASPTWPRMLLFALLAAACPLVKGNGALIALVPALDIALTRRWSLLRLPKLWAAALLAVALVAPWYWVSFRISAEGFNYAPGARYAWLALQDNCATLLANVGWAGIALALVGATAPGRSDEERRLASLATAVVLATLSFQSAVPAALVPRYCAPLLPWVVVLAGLALARLSGWGVLGKVAAGLLAMAAIVPSLAGIAALHPKADLGAPTIASAMVSRGGLYLVDGRSGAEGALIAAAAHADKGRRQVWVARASQWLSRSDFMGRDYRLTATTPGQARAVLDRLGAAGAISVQAGDRIAYPHSRVLLEAMRSPDFSAATRRFRTGRGRVIAAFRRLPLKPNAALLATDPMSSKAGRLASALGGARP